MKTPTPGGVERGRREVILLAGFCMFAHAMMTLRAWSVSGHFPGWLYPLSLLVAVVLGMLLVIGIPWARWLLVVFAALSGVGLMLGALRGFIYSPMGGAVMVLGGFLFLVVAWRIHRSPDLTAFLSPDARS